MIMTWDQVESSSHFHFIIISALWSIMKLALIFIILLQKDLILFKKYLFPQRHQPESVRQLVETSESILENKYF